MDLSDVRPGHCASAACAESRPALIREVHRRSCLGEAAGLVFLPCTYRPGRAPYVCAQHMYPQLHADVAPMHRDVAPATRTTSDRSSCLFLRSRSF